MAGPRPLWRQKCFPWPMAAIWAVHSETLQVSAMWLGFDLLSAEHLKPKLGWYAGCQLPDYGTFGKDAILLMSVMAGPDTRDPLTLPESGEYFWMH